LATDPRRYSALVRPTPPNHSVYPLLPRRGGAKAGEDPNKQPNGTEICAPQVVQDCRRARRERRTLTLERELYLFIGIIGPCTTPTRQHGTRAQASARTCVCAAGQCKRMSATSSQRIPRVLSYSTYYYYAQKQKVGTPSPSDIYSFYNN